MIHRIKNRFSPLTLLLFAAFAAAFFPVSTPTCFFAV